MLNSNSQLCAQRKHKSHLHWQDLYYSICSKILNKSSPHCSKCLLMLFWDEPWIDTKVECNLPPALAKGTGLLWHREWLEKQHPTGCFSNIHYFPARSGQATHTNKHQVEIEVSCWQRVSENVATEICAFRHFSLGTQVGVGREASSRHRLGQQGGLTSHRSGHPLVHSEHETPGSQCSVTEQLN